MDHSRIEHDQELLQEIREWLTTGDCPAIVDERWMSHALEYCVESIDQLKAENDAFRTAICMAIQDIEEDNSIWKDVLDRMRSHNLLKRRRDDTIP